MKSMDTFDYVIVGAGAAGCILANRLSENPNTRVALVEVGTDQNSRKAIIRIPLAMVSFMAPQLRFLGGPKFMQWFKTEPEPGLNNREIELPRGRGSGGSTLVNGQIYIRGQREDFDTWRELGNEGWGYDELLPYFRKIERFEPLNDPATDNHLPAKDERAAAPLDPNYHGINGDLNIAHIRSVNPLAQAFVTAASMAGHQFNADFNGAHQKGFGLYTFTQKGGERVTAESAFLDPIRNRSNLTILSERTATKILFEGKRATGITWRRADGITGVTHGTEVILSAGSYASPHLLLLSGVGDSSQLDQHDISTVHHLPGVGQNLQDHLDVSVEYRAKNTVPYGGSLRALPKNAMHLFNWLLRKRGMFSSTTADGGAFLSTTGSDRPDIQLFFCTGLANTQTTKGFGIHGFLMHVCQLRSNSTGTLCLKSADPLASPEIRYNFLQDKNATKILRDGIRMARQIILQTPFDSHRDAELAPGSDAEDDDALDDFIRRSAGTLFHPVGTCAMGNSPMSVVDPSTLSVHGVTGLRVVDASVMPTLVSGNTLATTCCIAEKAADLIMGDDLH